MSASVEYIAKVRNQPDLHLRQQLIVWQWSGAKPGRLTQLASSLRLEQTDLQFSLKMVDFAATYIDDQISISAAVDI